MKKALLGVAVLLLSRVAPSTTTPNTEEVVAWTEVQGASAREGGLEKLSPNGRDAGAVSSRSLQYGDGYLEFSFAGPSAGVACGLASHGHAAGYEEIDFALLESEGRFSIVESGRAQGATLSYSASDRFRIAVENGSVVYRQNGQLLFTSKSSVRYPLRVQASLRTPGSRLRNVVLAGALVENVDWVSNDGTRTYANDVVKARGTAPRTS